jgi:hypothetical protein
MRDGRAEVEEHGIAVYTVPNCSQQGKSGVKFKYIGSATCMSLE